LSDNGREFCGRPDRHPYELFLEPEGIEHRKTNVRRPQSHGIVARFHRAAQRALPHEGRRTWFETFEQMQETRDAYLDTYNTTTPHQRRSMNGRTPARAFLDRIPANDNTRKDNDQNIDQIEAA